MEKEFKGTKGKWEYNLIGFNASAYHCIKSKDGKTICLIYPKDHLSSEVECNAQLVAAAPELLEALIELVKINQQRLDGAGSWSCSKLWFRKTWSATERAVKVINKTLGL